MSNEIDWFEYERRKAELQSKGLTSYEYEQGLKQILDDLEREADERAAEEEAEEAA